MTHAMQGKRSHEELNFIEPAILVLQETFSEFDKNSGFKLAIFDGTSNQKMVILAWMAEVLKKDTEKLKARGENIVEQLAVDAIRNGILGLISKILEQASLITGSMSLLSEDDRKMFIEKYAHVIDVYQSDVEEALKTPSITFSDSKLLKESQSYELQPLPKGSLLDISTFIRDLHLENNAFEETEEKENCKTTENLDDAKTVPMTPINGVWSSRYVSPRHKGINIHEEAYADVTNQQAYVPYEMHINDTYEDIICGVPKSITYIGAKYPDGSSLSYLPIKNISVLRRTSDVRLPSRSEGGFVELRIPRISYERIRTLCTSAYLEKNPGHSLRYPLVTEKDSESVVINALARGYRRLRIIKGERIHHITLLEAIESCSHDFTGDALLHLRFDKQNSDEKHATMKVVFFGLQLVRTEKNHFQKIFRL